MTAGKAWACVGLVIGVRLNAPLGEPLKQVRVPGEGETTSTVPMIVSGVPLTAFWNVRDTSSANWLVAAQDESKAGSNASVSLKMTGRDCWSEGASGGTDRARERIEGMGCCRSASSGSAEMAAT